MSTVAEIEAAIEKLSPEERQQLRERLLKSGQPQSPHVPIGKKLLALAGSVKGLPEDFAANHDHYLHGLPKREP
jgi:hypothetical protein